MADVRTGQLKERIDIYETVNALTEFGGEITQNNLYWQTYASVNQLSSGKGLLSNQEQLKDAYRITVRSRKDKSTNKDLKVLWKGKWLNLISIVSDDDTFVVFVGTYKKTGEVAGAVAENWPLSWPSNWSNS